MKTKIFTPVVPVYTSGKHRYLATQHGFNSVISNFGLLNTHPSDMTNEYKRVECN